MFTLCKGYSDDEENEETEIINAVSEKKKSFEEKISYYKLKGKAERGHITIYTNLGEFEIEMYWYHSPKTCFNFYSLCEMGGDPTGTGKGGKSIYGEYFEDEINKELKHTGAGILSMSNNGPNTNSSQFFITLSPLPHLDGKHTIFARVSKNMTCIENIAAVKTTATNKPIFDVKILRTSTAVNVD
ncbi:cyclophilin [Plasmodium cynomolgi strain B]|uniref:peptidylprolyl isomerase n=1 Tax=Plasmodium cynomolgi (strain B) TaxID=1120755 RepID=K6UWJ7_PLACD|nr:cyclophilin [Plasmodium cynomolgi strain B]GAB66780.1 cyclophilin [Plasmodium cynomolgi strain B]